MIKRRALRQREWAIYINPYHVDSKGNIKHYTGVPKAMQFADFGEGVSGSDRAINLKGVAGGKETNSTMEYDESGWVMWYKSYSFPKLREKYRELLVDTPSDFIRVVEILPVDTLVTPLS